jgi:branched-chain amino acid aminotransferase
VCELTGDNLFIVKNSRVITPPLWIGILDGVTRRAILRVAREQGLETLEEPFTMHDVYTSDECLATATRLEIMPIVWVDGRQIGDGVRGPITAQINRGFRELVSREGAPVYDE